MYSACVLLLFLFVRERQFVASYRFADHLSNGSPDDGYDGENTTGGVTILADVPPPTATCLQDIWDVTDMWMSHYWPNDDVGFARQDQQGNNNDEQEEDDHQLTYGEVTALGVRQLAFEMNIAPTTCDSDDGSVDFHRHQNGMVFFDLGSGVGKLVTQLYLDLEILPHHQGPPDNNNNNNIINVHNNHQRRRLISSTGVELDEGRHNVGQTALKRLLEQEETCLSSEMSCWNNDDNNSNNNGIALIHGNALNTDLTEATHIFLSSLCFPENVLHALQEKILNQASKLEVVAALNRLHLLEAQDASWNFKQVSIQMSWGPGVANVYSRKNG